MSSPIEFRHYLRAFTLDHVRGNVQPIRMQGGRLYAPPALQWRYREKTVDGAIQWSEWQDVPFVREGDEPFHIGDVPITTDTVAQ